MALTFAKEIASGDRETPQNLRGRFQSREWQIYAMMFSNQTALAEQCRHAGHAYGFTHVAEIAEPWDKTLRIINITALAIWKSLKEEK